MSKQKAKGTRYETACVTVFAPRFPTCERRALRGINDAGDLTGLPVVVECKAGIGMVSEAMVEARRAAIRLGQRQYAAAIHARGKNPRDGYGVVPLWFLADLLWAWEQMGRPELEPS